MNTPQQVRGDERSFRDEYGTIWRVHEVNASELRSPRGARCLIFESAYAGRRVWGYPADWPQLTDGELEAISWGR